MATCMRSWRAHLFYRRPRNLALALCLIGAIVCMGTGEDGVSDVQLTVSETLALLATRGGVDNRYNFFRVANPNANPQLRAAFASGKRSSHHVTAPLILGYTGTKADAEFFIEWLQKLSQEFEKDPDRVVIEEKNALVFVFQSLGMMARRDVEPAKQFLTEIVKGKLKKPIKFRWYNDKGDTTLILALIGYGFLKPDDLGAQMEAAFRRAPPEQREFLGKAKERTKGVLEVSRSVQRLERLPIKARELEELRKKAAGFGKK